MNQILGHVGSADSLWKPQFWMISVRINSIFDVRNQNLATLGVTTLEAENKVNSRKKNEGRKQDEEVSLDRLR